MHAVYVNRGAGNQLAGAAREVRIDKHAKELSVTLVGYQPVVDSGLRRFVLTKGADKIDGVTSSSGQAFLLSQWTSVMPGVQAVVDYFEPLGWGLIWVD